MTLAQALKKKNKLVKTINDRKKRIRENNSILESNIRNYDVRKVWEEIQSLTKELIDLKVKIQVANGPILAKIYQLSELKDKVAFLRSVPTASGKVVERYSHQAETIYKAAISSTEIDSQVESLEEEIEKLQEEIDAFNHKKKI